MIKSVKTFPFVLVFLALLALVVFFGAARAKEPLADTTSSQSVLKIQEVTSASGLKAWLVEDHTVPVIALQFGFKDAGSKLDPPEKQGLTQMASNTLDEGAGELDSQAFQGELQNLSISLSFNSGRDDFSGDLKTLSRNKARAFELLKLALTQPRFDAEPVERMRIANLSRVKSSMTQPEWIASRIQNDKIFEGHSYALNSGGTLTTLKNITPDDLRGFMKRLGKNNLVVGVAGDITAEELKAVLDDVFGSLPEAPVTESKPFTLSHPGKTFLHVQDIPQTVIEMSQGGISRNDPDYQTAQVMNFVLGSSGFGSRLTEEVREKRGLTYGIYTYFMDYEDAQILHVSTSTATANVKAVLDIVNEEWTKMLSTDISPKELEDARNYLIGSLPLSLTSTDKIADLLYSLQADDLPITYLDERQKKIESTTVADVRRVAERLLKPENFTVILVGQKAEITGAVPVEALANVD
ncbi:MAG: insulinase family protein [Alphaproteobacteria bacterium]|nr:insulinase family protein [Alphaproteobacteria bacterium]MBP7759147.1 insulinase family protein [Alphaproteobacteria bacterium]MBP7763518.1 insulinase family protein [Alphaproteobacteria bacterium]MBP7906083.1 insulinase family protein [Alphaproteobacteria bacterium]